MKKHTEVEWEFCSSSGSVYRADGELECDLLTVNMDDLSEEDAEAVGNLSRAAPDLLAAAKELLAHAEFADGQGIVRTIDAEALEAAIARAEAKAIIAKTEGRCGDCKGKGPRMNDQLTNEDKAVLRRLHDRGFAVIVWTPAELGQMPNWEMEEESIIRGYDLIAEYHR